MRFTNLAVLLPLLASGVVEADTVLTGTAVPLSVGEDYASPQYFSLTANGSTKNYSGVGAGNFTQSTLNGVDLYMYCVDILHTISPGATYNAQVNTIGYIINDVPSSSGAQTTSTTLSDQTLQPNGTQPTSAATLTNAGQIGYLLVNFAESADTRNEQLALQAAIWEQVYGNNFTFNTSWYNSRTQYNNVDDYYASYLASLEGKSASFFDQYVGRVLWINPYTKKSNGTYSYHQGQVGYMPTPLPGTFAMAFSFFGTAIAGRCLQRLRKRRQAAA